MSKKKGRKKKPNERAEKNSGSSMNQSFPDPRLMERTMAGITRLLESQEFP